MRIHGHGDGGYIGVRPIEMTPELRQHFGAPKDSGVLVATVEADSPAAKAGLQVGDIITALDGERIGSIRELVRDVRHHRAGDTLKLEIVRSRAAKTLSVSVGKRPEQETRVGALGPMRHPRFKEFRHPEAFLVPPSDFGNLEERLDEVEKRLKEIESRLPNR